MNIIKFKEPNGELFRLVSESNERFFVGFTVGAPRLEMKDFSQTKINDLFKPFDDRDLLI